ncbi:MAG: hypothetical protein ACYTGH_00810 [Planctomycetota bacterium]|jgi:hypothetical protein
MAIFEAIMLICFGCSWPVANLKTWRAKRVEGQSVLFKWLIFIGYISGICFNLTREESGRDSRILLLYLFNLLMVGLGIYLYYRYHTPSTPIPESTPESAPPAEPESDG